MGEGSVGPAGLLVTGSAGRIGRALRALWPEKQAVGLPILWHGRQAQPNVDVVWDIGQNPPPTLPAGLIVLHLAGCTAGTEAELATNTAITEQVCIAARLARARHVFVMSSAAVYAPGTALTEADLPAPITPYGRAKLEAERSALRHLSSARTGLTLLRLANLAGADALFGNCQPGRTITLDPIAGQDGGPERSYIGPRELARVLSQLVVLAASGAELPGILNLAQPGSVAMADLLGALGQPWVFGPPRAAAIARVVLATEVLAGLVRLTPATSDGLVADLRSVTGWPR